MRVKIEAVVDVEGLARNDVEDYWRGFFSADNGKSTLVVILSRSTTKVSRLSINEMNAVAKSGSNGEGSSPWVYARTRRDKIIILLGHLDKPMTKTEIAQVLDDDERAVFFALNDLRKKGWRLLDKPGLNLFALNDAGRAEFARLMRYASTPARGRVTD